MIRYQLEKAGYRVQDKGHYFNVHEFKRSILNGHDTIEWILISTLRKDAEGNFSEEKIKWLLDRKKQSARVNAA